MHAFEQSDGNWLRCKRGGHSIQSAYHRWLKHARNRLIRRRVRQLLRQGEDPPPKFGYKGWES